jgi:hypothetical protein
MKLVIGFSDQTVSEPLQILLRVSDHHIKTTQKVLWFLELLNYFKKFKRLYSSTFKLIIPFLN